MKRTLFLISTLLLLLIPCGVAYAYDGVAGDDNVTTIEPAELAAAPHINVVGNAIGGIEAGDLFYIDISETALDTPFTLYITNTDELAHNYRYMNLNVGIYVQTSSDNWEEITSITGEPYPETYITMQNSMVSFTLPRNAKYKVTIDKGCFRSYCFSPGESVTIPDFYLTAD